MNIIQLHERVRFWVDVVSSTRFESEDLDNALNVAIDSKVRESYDQNRPMNKSDAFQRVQRVRDELGPLVKSVDDSAGLIIDSTLGAEEQSVSMVGLTDYSYLLAIKIQDETASLGWHPCYPLTHDRKNIISRNPYRRVRTTPQSKSYYIEREGKLDIVHALGSFGDAKLDYLATPAIVNWGVERTSSYTFSNGESVIPTSETVYAGTTYVIGQKFTIVTGSGLNITSGSVVHQFVECDVRGSTHEEISRRGAMNLLLTAGENEKVTALRQEIMAQ